MNVSGQFIPQSERDTQFSGEISLSRKPHYRGRTTFTQTACQCASPRRARASLGVRQRGRSLLPPEHDGEVVECRDRTNRLIGTGIFNSKSQIVWRRLSRERVTLDAAFFRAAIERAVACRAVENARRWFGVSRTTCPESWSISLVTPWSCRFRHSRWKIAQP